MSFFNFGNKWSLMERDQESKGDVKNHNHLANYRTPSNDSDQPAQLRRLIWVIAWQTGSLVGNSVARLILFEYVDCLSGQFILNVEEYVTGPNKRFQERKSQFIHFTPVRHYTRLPNEWMLNHRLSTNPTPPPSPPPRSATFFRGDWIAMIDMWTRALSWWNNQPLPSFPWRLTLIFSLNCLRSEAYVPVIIFPFLYTVTR